jgi:hypothetical protein
MTAGHTTVLLSSLKPIKDRETWIPHYILHVTLRSLLLKATTGGRKKEVFDSLNFADIEAKEHP